MERLDRLCLSVGQLFDGACRSGSSLAMGSYMLGCESPPTRLASGCWSTGVVKTSSSFGGTLSLQHMLVVVVIGSFGGSELLADLVCFLR